MKKLGILSLSFIIILFAASFQTIDKAQRKNQHKPYNYFEDPQVCSGCHWDKFTHWSTSQHSRSFSGDFFQRQFYDLVIASESFAPELKDARNDCIGCHAPSAFLAGEMTPDQTNTSDNFWKSNDGNRRMAERGIFCDFCHTISHFKNDPPFNHDYVSDATDAVDTKYGDLEFPWSPHHETATSEHYEAPFICASCHNELNPYNVWVKSTYTEYEESVYPGRGIVCQTCHMQPMGGKPAKMGVPRPYNSDHWFGGGFTEFVEGAAHIEIKLNKTEIKAGEKVDFSIDVQAVATGHKFPTGSTEERDVWLRVALVNEKGEEMFHIPVMKNADDPNDKYFITSNEKVAFPSHSKLSEPIARDALPEGDRLYHSAFLDNEGEFTFAQWMTVKVIENRLNPMEIRNEKYSFVVPEKLEGNVYLSAKLNYRRMPCSLADYFGMDHRPVIEVNKDIRKLKIN
ncbi:MAG: hypothetical protein JW833_04300 [Prolixibacteraceae bacterium]|nr:hypothetical protein [Prolixibacteraceae bacterium]